MALNIETYQLAKKNLKGSGGGSSDNTEILDRLEKLESSQSHLYAEFIEEFTNAKYIDEYKTTALLATNKVVARQFRDIHVEDFKDDSGINWAESINIIIENESARISYSNINDGTLVFNRLNVSNLKGFKLNSMEKHYIISAPGEVSQLSIAQYDWMESKVDPYGRLWLFDAKRIKSSETDGIYLTIFNPDMTVHKERELFFKYWPSLNDYHIQNNAACIVFDEIGNAFIGLNFHDSDVFVGNDTDSINYFYSVLLQASSDGTLHQHIRTYLTNINGNSSGYYRGAVVNIRDFLFYEKGKLYYNYFKVQYGNTPDVVNKGWSYCDIYSWDSSTRKHTLDRIYNLSNRHGYHNNNAWGRYTTGEVCYIRDVVNDSVVEVYQGDLLNGVAPSNHLFATHFDLKANPTSITTTNLAMDGMSREHSCRISHKCGYIQKMHYSKKDNAIYFLAYVNYSTFSVTKAKIDFVSKKCIAEPGYPRSVNISGGHGEFNTWVYSPTKILEDGDSIHILFTGKQDGYANTVLKYMVIDKLGNIQLEPIFIAGVNETYRAIYNFEIYKLNGDIRILYNKSFYTGGSSNQDYNCIESCVINQSTTSIRYEYLDIGESRWKPVNTTGITHISKPQDYLTLKAILSSGASTISPSLDSMTINYWSEEESGVTISEFYSKRIPGVENSGRAVFTVNDHVGDGIISYYVSYDGGETYSAIKPGEEFNYNMINTPDFRVKTVFEVANGSDNPPYVSEYKVTSNHVVMHSDLERVQLNLIKTNFKIDSFTKGSSNGLHKMHIDVFNDDSNVDKDKSLYNFISAAGSITGEYLTFNPFDTREKIKSILLSAEENLSPDHVNSRIEYFISTDGGKTFVKIRKNVKESVGTENSLDANIIIKAVLYENASISAIGWAWD